MRYQRNNFSNKKAFNYELKANRYGVDMDFLLNFPFLKESTFKKNEKKLIKLYLIVALYHEVKKIFDLGKKSNLQTTVALYTYKDDGMIDTDFLCDLIKDILATKEYTLPGIANYIRIPKEIIYDLISGVNKSPSPNLWIKLLELHILVRKEAYRNLIKKIILNPNLGENDKENKDEY